MRTVEREGEGAGWEEENVKSAFNRVRDIEFR